MKRQRSPNTLNCVCFVCVLILSPHTTTKSYTQHCEYNPIFYDRSQVELLANGQFWLSDLPEVRLLLSGCGNRRRWEGEHNDDIGWGVQGYKVKLLTVPAAPAAATSREGVCQ